MENSFSAFEEHFNILLVEDNPTDAELIMATLLVENSHLKFRVVDTEKELKTSLNEFQPKLIISDYSLPGFSGMEALAICRTLKPDIPFIFVSGTIGEERAVEALKQGATDYVLKGSLTRLPHALNQAITRQREKRQKQQQQEELARTYELLNSVFDTTHMLVGYMDTNFNFIQVNRAFSECCSANRVYFTGKNFFKIFPNQKIEVLFKGVVQSGKAHFSYAEKLITENIDRKDSLIVDWSLAPTKSYGVVEGVVFTAVDVSERVKNEQEVVDTRKQFHDALNQAPDAVVIANQSGEIVFFSEQAQKSFGYSNSEILGKKVEVLIPRRFARNHVKTRDHYTEKPGRREMGAMVDLFAMRKDGTEFPVDINLGPLSWEGGTGTMVMLRDITSKKEQQKELKLLSTVASHIDNAVYIGDQFLHPKWVNGAFTNLTGYELNDIKGKSPTEIYTNGQQEGILMIEGMIDQMEQGKYMHEEMVLHRKDGSSYWCSIHASPIMDQDGKLIQVVAIMNNITKRKNAELERDDLLNNLERKVEQRTEELKHLNIVLENKNKDVADSIAYAKHIQNAFIPKIDRAAHHLSHAFVIDLPKDVLSGDFHWSAYSSTHNCSYIAVGDCTGHGVPGSLMTMLAVQMLEQHILTTEEQKSPEKVLAAIDDSMVKFLKQDEGATTIHDGMEILLLRIDHEKQQVHYSSAGRPIYLHSQGVLSILKNMTKHAVGGVTKGVQKEFILDSFNYQKGDRLYVSSDGFADQFGGDDGKKMLRRRQEEFLSQIQNAPFANHKKLVRDYFLKWKGDYAQVDDVVVLGLEL